MVKGTVSDRQKAAILCIELGALQAAKIMKHLRPDELELLTFEIAQCERITTETRDNVLREFAELTTAQRFIRNGGIDYAREVLEEALGEKRARELLERLTSTLQKRPFDGLRRIDPGQLAGFLQNEHPQTIAVVMAHLPPEMAAVVLTGLPPDRQADVIQRCSLIERTSPEMLREVERVLERKLSALVSSESTTAGGVTWAVEVLNRVDASTERTIMEHLGRTDPDLAQEIAERMFLFTDIIKLDDVSVQRVLRDVDMQKDMPMALKGAPDEVWRKITNNISRRAAESLKEAVDFLGPVRIRDVEAAQARIIAVIRRLEEQGEIQITKGGVEDEFI